MIWYQLRSRAEPGGSRGAVAPASWKKNPRSRYIMNYSVILWPKKKKNSHLAFNTKKVGKKNFLPNTKSYHFFTKYTILISFISQHTSSSILLFLFSKEIVFSLLFTTLFLWNNDMNIINFTNWRFINHKK